MTRVHVSVRAGGGRASNRRKIRPKQTFSADPAETYRFV
jgi:hypothetical protein